MSWCTISRRSSENRVICNLSMMTVYFPRWIFPLSPVTNELTLFLLLSTLFTSTSLLCENHSGIYTSSFTKKIRITSCSKQNIDLLARLPGSFFHSILTSSSCKNFFILSSDPRLLVWLWCLRHKYHREVRVSWL